MRHRLGLLLLLVAALAACAPAALPPRAPPPEAAIAPGSVLVLSYHDVQDSAPDQTFVGVSTAKLIEQFEWLRANGYTAISIDDLLAARGGTRPLPAKPVLITFDDGYDSFYTRAYPVLRAFNYPAVLALVGSWMAVAPGQSVSYGDAVLPRERFVTWDQVREMARSGLVEMAAHSNAHHRGIRANPQGNEEPAIVTRRFDAGEGYEGDAVYARRVRDDLDAIAAAIERETGVRPRVMVWPYGAYNRRAIALSAEIGMPWTLTLDDGLAGAGRMATAPRLLVANDPGLDTFAFDAFGRTEQGPVRVVHVDLDYVYDPDPEQQERNLGTLIQRIRDLEVSTVYLQAFADPDASGLVRQVYFPNRHLPLRADLLNRVAWQLRTRARVEVFAWMPVLAFDFGATLPPVLAWSEAGARPDPDAYRRLSPFDPEARERILELYEDLAKAAPINGLLFHDDALLSDFEDASAPALAAYARAGLPPDIARLRAEPALRARWARLKTETLIAFTHELAERARQYRSPLKTARNIYARPVLEPESEDWFAQNLDAFLAAYDQTAIMAMPYMEEVPEDQIEDWLRRMVATVTRHPDGLKRTVFELQSVDWRKEAPGQDRRIPSATLARQMRLLARLGALNFGYYPDDFAKNHPDASAIHPALSLKTHPFR